MSIVAVFAKRPPSTGAKMVRNVARKPPARLVFEVFVVPAAIVAERLFVGRFDVDQRQVIQSIPNEHATELAQRDAALPKLVLGPERRAVHVEQRAVEIEEGGNA